MTDLLKLLALDEQDLQIISAYVQDSLTTQKQIKYDKQTKQFIMTLRRYVWEAERKWRIFARKERRLAIVHFNKVKNVKTQNLKNNEEIMSLLTIKIEKENEIKMYFAGNINIILEVEDIEAQLSDQSGGWKSRSMPKHGK